MNRLQASTWVNALAICWTLLSPVKAHDIKPFSLHTSTDNAELIFRGRVIDVEHRLSDVTSKDHVALPHTFVTYNVEEVVKGDFANDRITLRFIGGFDATTNRYMTVDGVPQRFNLDDDDILFVNGNGKRPCPLENCEAGRFRVVDQRLYSHHGREVFLNARGRISFGNQAPPEDHQRLRIMELADPGQRSAIGERNDAVEKGKIARRDTSNLGLKLNASELLDVIFDRAKKSPTPKNANRARSVSSAELFTVRNPRALRPPLVRAVRAPAAARNANDRLEEATIKARGANPVLR